MPSNANWRITFPIEKAEQRDDGIFLTGLASGPEIDAEGERMDEALIHKFADQINSTGGIPLAERLIYRDAHAPDGVLRDLGWLTKAWVNNAGQLAVEVRLDEENPAAMYLFRAIKRGKQYGMSVAGKVIDFVDEFIAELGKTIRTYLDVVLTEISNTTRPAWTPSFGSVLAKAIDDAAEAESLQGDIQVKNKELAQETTEASADAETITSEEEETTGEETEKETDETTESEDEDVEKAGRKVSAETGAKLVGIYNEWGATLRELGLIEGDETASNETDKSDSEDDAETVKSEDETPSEITQLSTRIDDLVRSNTELAAKVIELEAAPKTTLPPVIDGEAKEDFEKAMAELPRDARLRVAFAALTKGK